MTKRSIKNAMEFINAVPDSENSMRIIVLDSKMIFVTNLERGLDRENMTPLQFYVERMLNFCV